MSNENVCPQVLGGVLRELRKLAERPPAGIKLLLRGNDVSDVRALIEGPVGTPYEGGVFEVRLSLGAEYPTAAPRAYFVTRVFHPNVAASGEVCVNTLAREWRPALGLAHALLALRCLLIAPNPDSALDAEAAALLRDHYPAYAARARLYTDIHARPNQAQKTEMGGPAPAEEPLAKLPRRAPVPDPAVPGPAVPGPAVPGPAVPPRPAPASKADRERRRHLKRL